MKNAIMIFALSVCTVWLQPVAASSVDTAYVQYVSNTEVLQPDIQVSPHNQTNDEGYEVLHDSVKPAVWAVIPFIVLLLMIATGPLFYEHFWHKYYPSISIVLAVLVVLFYLIFLKNVGFPVHSGFEYVQFISLLFALYVASGGIFIKVDRKATAGVNAMFLVVGAIISNFIGTTGASMLLIRPFMKINGRRLKPYHVVFFIFIVSNVGGSLTPIGDPPLFLGFLKGVPFSWTLTHNFFPWLIAVSVLSLLFYIVDKRNPEDKKPDIANAIYEGKISISGNRNFIWLGIIIAAVFLDPNIYEWVPAVHYHGNKFSFLRELIMLTVAFISYRYANKNALSGNDFTFEPIKEVAFLFIGIFGTMMPALELIGDFAQSKAGIALINPNTLYWGTGTLSAFLDNAPTYLNFLAAAMASQGASINSFSDVQAFAEGHTYFNSVLDLKAVSIAAVFFGAMTYIGNGPNFMVKSIAEERGMKMPSFFGYLIRYSIPMLLPLFIVIWLLFFYFS